MTDNTDPSIVDVLTSDHEAVRTLLRQLRAGESVPSEVVEDAQGRPEIETPEMLRELLVTTAVQHFVAEEEYLYPQVRDLLADGAAAVDTAFGLNRHCERELKTLERRKAEQAEVDASLARFADFFDKHVQMAEVFCDELERGKDEAELRRLGGLALGVEQVAPTRPRTLATEAPGVAAVSNLVEGFVDRIRDAYSRRGRS